MDTLNHSNQSWEKFLTPEILRTNLMLASTYITAFEVLRSAIIDRVKQIYSRGYDEEGIITDTSYDTEVLSKNRSQVYASLLWLQEENVLTDRDIEAFTIAKDFRNVLAHEMPQVIFEGLTAELPEYFGKMTSLLNKIEKWWIICYELPTVSEHNDMDIDESKIIPGSIASLKMMLDITLGSDEEAQYYITQYNQIFSQPD